MFLYKSVPDLPKLLLKPVLQLFQSFEEMQIKPIKIYLMFFLVQIKTNKKVL